MLDLRRSRDSERPSILLSVNGLAYPWCLPESRPDCIQEAMHDFCLTFISARGTFLKQLGSPCFNPSVPHERTGDTQVD